MRKYFIGVRQQMRTLDKYKFIKIKTWWKRDTAVKVDR